MLTRRGFLRATMEFSAGAALGFSTRDAISATDLPITMRLRNAAPIKVPANFIGLGYEMSSVAVPSLLSTENHRYVELIKGLGSQGVLRVGGIVANYTRYDPNGTARAERENTVITHSSLEQFGAFLRRVGWSAIWSVNFAQGSLADAIIEVRAVAAVLGSQLLALELGNEVENYARGDKRFREPPYDYDTYRKEYNEWHASILKAVPNICFAAPDTASSIEWVERMAKDSNHDVQLLTTHYYRANQKHGSVEQLLQPDPQLKDALVHLRKISEQSGIPWRMCETNSFSGGGRPGVSDTFVGALWTLDYMLLLAEYGCSGVNIETGVNQLGFISFYSPVRDDGKGMNIAAAPYYGMLAFAAASADCPEVLPIDMDTHGINMTAYVLGAAGKPLCVVAVNRDGLQDMSLYITELKMGDVLALRLHAPSPDSSTGVTFGGSGINPEGRWTAKTDERIHGGVVTVPRMSAIVLRSVDQHASG